MAIPAPKVEIGFDLTDSPIGPFFRLNDVIEGRLDNTGYRLGGTIFFDVTDRVKGFRISRGKGRKFANFRAGVLSVEFNNHDRAFDPVYPDSPFAGNIIPRREIRVSAEDEIQFTGWIDDWNLSYSVDGNSIVDATATDAFGILAGQNLPALVPSKQRTDQRIDAVLDNSEVRWAKELRDLEQGTVSTGTQEISAGTNALNYMQKVTETELGLFFIGKDGSVTFRNRVLAPTSENLVTFDQGANIPYKNIGIIFGSELLYNEITIANVGGGTAVATAIESQNEYGISALAITDLLGATDQQSVDLAIKLIDQFSQPEYRIETLEVCLHDIDQAEQDKVLGLELGSVCKVQFTPNNIGDPIIRFVSVIRIEHDVRPSTHYVTFGFQEIKYLALVLNDAVFGKLDEGRLAEGGITRILTFVLDDTSFGKLGIGTLG